MIRRNWIKALAFGLIAVVSNSAARADVIVGIADLYSTGVNNSHAVLPDGSPDQHYTIVSAPTPSLPTAVAGNQAPGSWVAAPAGSQWIHPTFGGDVNGVFTYQTTFSLSNYTGGFFNITGKVSADDQLDNIIVNGTALNIAFSPNIYGTLYDFSITNPLLVHNGVNTIQFVTRNTNLVVTGLLVNMSGTYSVPEPTSIAMLGLGVVGLAAGRRFRSRRVG